jgi:thymidine kinase/ribonuclease HI
MKKRNMPLIFNYGTMNSLKTTTVILKLKQLDSQGKKVVLIKPQTPDGSNTLKSRDLEIEVDVDILVSSNMSDFSSISDVDYVLVDDCQFMSVVNVNGLKCISDKVTIVCYGLLIDYKSELFTGSKRLVEVCDEMNEMKSTCSLCTSDAKLNAKYSIKDEARLFLETGDDVIDMGSDEKYQPMCWECFKKSKKLNNSVSVTMFFDGGSRGNPGIAGCGAVIYDESGHELSSVSFKMAGDSNTNNEAEYKAIIIGLENLLENGYLNAVVKGDSQLVIKQLTGEYKCKSPNLITFHDRAKFILTRFENVKLEHIPRALNKRADELANMAMDK